MKKSALLLAVVLYFASFSYSQIPAGYYDPANGLYGTALQSALHDIIKGHTVVTYQSLWYYFESTDKKPDGTVWDMYSDVPGGTPPYVYYFNTNQCGTYHVEGDCFNREHSWPKSWFGGEVEPMYTDIFHLYPVDGYVNGMRNDNPYGEVSSPTYTSENGSMIGANTTPGYTGKVFEPLDGYKGDLARTYFYMSTRYYTEDSGWPGSDAVTGSQLKPWALNMMLIWNSQDPVSQKEIDRNNAVYTIQNNRNPFIDHPEFAQNIWGPNAGIAEKGSGVRVLMTYPNPALDHCYMILPVACNEKDCELRVTNVTGTNQNVSFAFEGSRVSADVSQLPSGIYFSTLTISGKTGTYIGKIVKE
ncbi:MAG: endonuclease [Bacteroidetes bacterium]|nr:endonuclease [Bacteroidota bacterium]